MDERFYGGMLWQLYRLTGDTLYKEEAENLEDKLDAVLLNYKGMDHDSGFRFLPTAVADFRITGRENQKPWSAGCGKSGGTF